MVNKLLWALDVGFNSHIWGGCGTENVKNCSHGLEFFVCHFVADAGNIFRLNNHVFCVAYVKDVTDSMQNLFSPHKTYCSHGALYLNVSEHIFYCAQSIPMFEIFVLNKRILSKIHHDKMLNYLHF
jgi:hypothetical protein